MHRIIVVTGGAGHVGSHVIEQLLVDPKLTIISLDNYSNGSVNNHIDNKRVEYRRGNTAHIARHVPERPNIVFHLGEYARIATSFDEPSRVFRLNNVGTHAVAEFCRLKKCKLVYAASSTKFGDGDGKHQSPYSLSKAQNVDLIMDYGKWYGLDYVICYFFNAFGPREKGTGKYGTVIAKFEQAYLEKKPFQIVLPGTQKRNFTYVSDLARGIVLAGEKGQGDGYALNHKKSYTITEIAEAFGRDIEFVEGRPGRNDTVDLPTKAHNELGWKTSMDIMDYIRDFKRQNPR